MRGYVSPVSALLKQWRRVARRLRSERGSVMVMVTGGLVILLGIAGLTLDSGRAFLVKSQLSRAVDAGVLAGARALRAGRLTARNQALAVVRANGVEAGKGATSVHVHFGVNADGENTVTVTARSPMPTTLMRLLGREVVDIASTATAAVPPVDLVLVLDQSGSLRTAAAWDDLQRAARGFVTHFSETMDQFGLVSFHTRAAVRFPLQNHFRLETQRIIQDMRSLGWTNTAEGLELAHQQITSQRARARAVKVVVFFTDGRPTAFRGTIGGEDRILAVAAYSENVVRGYFDDPDQISMDRWDRPAADACQNVVNCEEWTEGGPPPHNRRGREIARQLGLEVADRIRADGVYVYTIALGNPLASSELARPDLDYLSRLANEHGSVNPDQPRGRMYFAPTPEDLDAVFNRVASDLVIRLSH